MKILSIGVALLLGISTQANGMIAPDLKDNSDVNKLSSSEIYALESNAYRNAGEWSVFLNELVKTSDFHVEGCEVFSNFEVKTQNFEKNDHDAWIHNLIEEFKPTLLNIEPARSDSDS
ncbi:MAG: hypothetical protein LBB34_00730 [Holosporales bacterium]|jgi:hypothetical protein|nr:hypothetical protein [Holosporales bacterium]